MNTTTYTTENPPPTIMEIQTDHESFQVSIQESTHRVKGKRFDSVTRDPESLIKDVLSLWSVGTREFQNPLVQARHVCPIDQEAELLELVSERNAILPSDSQVRVNGRIPFMDPDTDEHLAIYFTSIEDSSRAQFNSPNQVDHGTAIQTFMEKGLSEPRPLPEGVEIRAIRELQDGEIYDYLSDEVLEEMDTETVARQLAELHTQSFAHAHDRSQTKPSGQSEILKENPVIVAIDTTTNEIVAAGLMEQDTDFNFGITLTEPTFYTARDYRRQGISTHLRKTMQHLIDMPTYFNRGYQPTIIFNESIRGSSFIGSLRAGCKLSGDLQATGDSNGIDGNLGNAYTYIGPANPETGLMPMGLTHWTSNSIRVE